MTRNTMTTAHWAERTHDSGSAIKCKSTTTSELTASEFAARRQAHRIVESLELFEEMLADEMVANEIVKLLRIRDKDLFRVRRVLQAFERSQDGH